MSQLADAKLEQLLSDATKIRIGLQRLIQHIAALPESDEHQALHHLADRVSWDLEKAIAAAARTEVPLLAWCTRNLFELTFMVDYVCRDPRNLERFLADSARDELEQLDQIEALERRRSPDFTVSPAIVARRERRKTEIAAHDPNITRPLWGRDFARAVDRESEFDELHRFYSKMSHPSAWAVLGGASWNHYINFVLINANAYAAECFSYLARRTGFSRPTS